MPDYVGCQTSCMSLSYCWILFVAYIIPFDFRIVPSIHTITILFYELPNSLSKCSFIFSLFPSLFTISLSRAITRLYL